MKKAIANENKGKKDVGILLHVSSLPNKYGIGTTGKSACEFIDILCARGIRYWQVLPLVQTSFGDSPYQTEYSGSGNPYFIDLDILAEEGLLTKEEIEACSDAGKFVDYGGVYVKKYAVLRKAFSRFDTGLPSFRRFVSSKKYEDFALFSAIKQVYGGAPFDTWEKSLKYADETAIKKFKKENEREYLFRLFLQYEFLSQWRNLKKYANARGVKIIGDLPLYVSCDSTDVWKNPELFKLDKNMKPKKVAGVPPDYFSATGQLWGNPVYNWKIHEQTGYAWWIDRFKRAFELYDVIRLDHFRGFDRYYEINADETTAVNGKWVSGPKNKLFRAVKDALGDVQIIAEDLGTLDEGVYSLLRKTGFPGMKVIEFAFDGNPDNPYLPKNINENSVCYTGTHDNDTLVGFVRGLSQWDRERLIAALRSELPKSDECRQSFAVLTEKRTTEWTEYDAAMAMMILALTSESRLTIIPMQDVLYEGAESRMNTPSTSRNNWKYRISSFDIGKLDEFYNLCKITGRSH